MSKSVISGMLLLALGCRCAAQTREPVSPARKPNIIVIVADDLGYADVGAQGILRDVRTPNIDSIAEGGVRFTNGYVSCPVCSPTRAGLMTGRYQQRFGHELNPPPPPATGVGLPKDQILLPQILARSGYATGMVGKWHLGMGEGYRPWERGFEEYFGFLHGQHDYFDLPDVKMNRRDPVLRGGNLVRASASGKVDFKPIDEQGYLTDLFADEAVSFIDRHHQSPFFLYLAFNAVHLPQQATDKYLARFPDITDHRRRLMLAMLSAMDDAVGRVLDSIRKHQLESDTLIFFISDNGGPTKGNASRNDPFSGFKSQTLEGGIREPFMVQWKNHLTAGKVLDQPVIQLDIFATACGAAELDAPKNIDGVNLLPLLTGQSTASPHEFLFWRYGEQWAVRDARYKLVKSQGQSRPKLIDLSTDIKEEHDLSTEHPEALQRLQSAYQQWESTVIPPRWRRSGPTGEP